MHEVVVAHYGVGSEARYLSQRPAGSVAGFGGTPGNAGPKFRWLHSDNYWEMTAGNEFRQDLQFTSAGSSASCLTTTIVR